jgi:hypothetical protein
MKLTPVSTMGSLYPTVDRGVEELKPQEPCVIVDEKREILEAEQLEEYEEYLEEELIAKEQARIEEEQRVLEEYYETYDRRGELNEIQSVRASILNVET